MSDNRASLLAVLDKHASPPPEIISQLPKGGVTLDFVGHAETTRILIEIDPEWSWEPQAWSPDGGPLVVQRGNLLVLWGWMTLLGKRLPCVGTCEAKKVEADKELIGDLIRNGAMRFGIALNLWSKAEKADEGFQPERTNHDIASVRYPVGPDPAWDEERWLDLSKRLRALPDGAVKDALLLTLIKEGIFKVDAEGRRLPSAPFTDAQLDRIEHLLAKACAKPEPDGPSPAALLIVTEATGFDNPTERAEVEPWMWELAEVEDLDAHDWKTTAKAASMNQRDLVDMARGVAASVGLAEPDRITDIHGDVAVELRLKLISSSAPF